MRPQASAHRFNHRKPEHPVVRQIRAGQPEVRGVQRAPGEGQGTRPRHEGHGKAGNGLCRPFAPPACAQGA